MHIVLFCIVAMVLGLANTVGYHRLLSHKAFKTPTIVRWGLTFLSALHSGSPILWVGVHRLHHLFSDREGDMHSTNDGFFHAHAGWLFNTTNPLVSALLTVSGFGLQLRYLVTDIQRVRGKVDPVWHKTCRDLLNEPFMRFLDKPFVIPALFALQVALAWWIGAWWGILWLWAMHVVQNNMSWVVNSFCHWPSFGNAADDSRDMSRDVPWLSLFTNGDSYHNSHHRFPASARHAIFGGLDMSWLFICLMGGIGLATEVKLPGGIVAPAWMERRNLVATIPGTAAR